MAVHVPNDQEDIAEPLFKLDDGVADSSAGIICAKMAGVNRDVVIRAKEIVEALKMGKQLTPNRNIPLKDIANSINISPAVKDALQSILKVNSWEKTTDEEIKDVLGKISKI